MKNVRYEMLLIEDDKVDQMAFQRFVKENNVPYDYKIAGSIAEAKEILEADSFDIIIGDYMLGDGTIFDIIDLGIDAPLVVTTGKGDEDTAANIMKSGVSDYLIKDSERNYLKVLPSTVEKAIKQKKMEEELQLTRFSIENSSDLVFRISPTGKILYTNKACSRALGYPREELLSMNWSQITPNISSDMIEEMVRNLKDEGSFKREFIFRMKGCDAFPVDIQANYQVFNKKEYVFISARDITERKQAEEEAEFYNSLLRHDVGNRNQVAMGYLEILKETDLSEEQREFVKKVLQSTKMSNDLIQKIRRLEKLKEKHELEDISLNSVMDKIVKNLSPIATDKGIKINYKSAKIMVKADSLLEDLFSNLIQNAVVHSGCSEINVYAKEENDFCKISIEDNGKGIPANEKEKIFQRSVKGKKSSGSGVGLYLVKTIAESYNGKVEVTNRIKGDYSKGTRFNVYIPRGIVQDEK